MLLAKPSGNLVSEQSIASEEFINIYNFCLRHKKIGLFGNGKIGTALKNYMENAGLAFDFDLTSKNIADTDLTDTGLIIAVGDEIYNEVLPTVDSVIDDRSRVLLLSRGFKKRLEYQSPLRVRDLFHLIIFTTTKCNLNCKSCSTFAPILSNSPSFYDFDLFKKDLTAFKNLEFERINVLKLTGGEPFLHPQIFEMAAFTRSLFPDMLIEIYTNGSLLPRLSEIKLKELSDLKIKLVITEYPPLKNKINDFYEIADNIDINYTIITYENQKLFSKRPLDFTKSTPRHLYAACPRFQYNSVFLYNSGIYRCVYSMLSSDVSRQTGKELLLEDGDFLNIQSTNPEEIYNFLISRKPFCGYCKPISELIPWGISERKLSEWT
jgi:organic radical activating enzyme